jgi:hypothetical protein
MSQEISGVVEKAEGAVRNGAANLRVGQSAADELKKVSLMRALIQQAKQGRGALGVLLPT